MDGRGNGVTVVIPILNEAETIGAVVASLSRDIVVRVIVVDGGSVDDRLEAARRARAELINAGRGYGRACATVGR
jgi:glycosyltransferase involved in cell wall biosynthesis